MFDADYLYSLPSDPLSASKLMLNDFFEKEDKGMTEREYIEAYHFITNYILVNKIFTTVPDIQKKEGVAFSITSILSSLEEGIVNLYTRNLIKEYIGDNTYELVEDDVKKIRELIDKVRYAIEESIAIDDDHKERIIARLNSLCNELDKKRTNFDKLLGGVVRIGIVLNKFGDNAKPAVERIQELGGVLYKLLEKIEKITNPTTPAIPFLDKDIDEIE